jgi:MoaA/NifB/PqqE/SkfB family radical SAM enzyme
MGVDGVPVHIPLLTSGGILLFKFVSRKLVADQIRKDFTLSLYALASGVSTAEMDGYYGDDYIKVDPIKVVFSSEYLSWFKEEVLDTHIRGIRMEVFQPKYSWRCGYCEYLGECFGTGGDR